MEKTLAVFIPIALFICITLCIYFVSRFRYEAITKLGGPIPHSPKTKYSVKKTGIIIIGFALGLLTTGFAFNMGWLNNSNSNGFFIVGTISLFVGAAFLIAEQYGNDDKKQDEDPLNG